MRLLLICIAVWLVFSLLLPRLNKWRLGLPQSAKREDVEERLLEEQEKEWREMEQPLRKADRKYGRWFE